MQEFEPESLTPAVVNWTLISEDPIRREHILPWLQKELEQATDNGLHDRDPGREFWLGFRDALKLVIEQPEREVAEFARQAALAKETERKKDEDGRRVRAGSKFLRRINPNWWNAAKR